MVNLARSVLEVVVCAVAAVVAVGGGHRGVGGERQYHLVKRQLHEGGALLVGIQDEGHEGEDSGARATVALRVLNRNNSVEVFRKRVSFKRLDNCASMDNTKLNKRITTLGGWGVLGMELREKWQGKCDVNVDGEPLSRPQTTVVTVSTCLVSLPSFEV